jgi:hypothetical protein
MASTETSKIFSSKAEARRLSRRLRDHGLLSRCDYARGHNKVTILVPEKFELPAIDNLCDRIMAEAA